jgi:hypothetical protein
LREGKGKFSFYQTSPVISHYLSSVGLHRQHRLGQMNTRFVPRDTETESSYLVSVKQSLQESAERWKAYSQTQQEATQARLKCLQDLELVLAHEQQRAEKLLAQPNEVNLISLSILAISISCATRNYTNGMWKTMGVFGSIWFCSLYSSLY